jgi:hypothetical protein
VPWRRESSSSSSSSQSHHYLADSSLSQDLNRYDFTGASMTAAESPSSDAAVEEATATPGAYIELEDDDLGRHPCMAQLVAVSRLMADRDMYPLPKAGLWTRKDPYPVTGSCRIWIRILIIQNTDPDPGVKIGP